MEQIKRKWKDLRDVFVKADKKINEKKILTYYENSIYQRLYFLKPFINHHGNMTNAIEKQKSKKNTSTDVQVCNYEKWHAQGNKTITDDILRETNKYLNHTKKNVYNEAAETLNGIIQQHSDKNKQILCLNFILRSISEFRKMSIDKV